MAIDTTLSVRLGIINHPKRLTLGIWVLADRASFLAGAVLIHKN